MPAVALTMLLAACGGTTADNVPLPTAGDDDDSQDASTPDAASPVDASSSDSSTPPHEDASPPPVDAAPQPDASIPGDPTDGTPTPHACTTGLGNGLSKGFGRLDGTLAAKQCGAVDTHLHVQIWMKGASYDVAINLDTFIAEKDAPPPGAPWSEGWHAGGTMDYPSVFGLHSADFTQPASMNDLASKIEAEIANANHISIYATGYGPDGIHDVHRKYKGSDGVIVVHPLSGTAHMLMFRFVDDTF